jgi:hypothetical protein
MPANVLVVVVDGLRASALGAYGNTTFATPTLDRFAAESLLLDGCYAPSPDLAGIYRQMWSSPGTSASLPRVFADHGYESSLLTDEPMLAQLREAADFDDLLQLSASSATSAANRGADPYKTALALPFSAAGHQLQRQRRGKPCLLWLHSRGMYGPWDAPLEFQQSLLDDDDPPPLELLDPPDLTIATRPIRTPPSAMRPRTQHKPWSSTHAGRVCSMRSARLPTTTG